MSASAHLAPHPGRPAAAAQPSPDGLLRRWVGAFVVGELIGFVPPALTGAALAANDAGDVAMTISLTAAGLLEGLAIGVAQRHVLQRHAPAIDGGRWVLATTAGAGLAWLVGMGGSAALQQRPAPLAVLIAVLVPLWVVGLLAMGAGQWLVMRPQVPHSSRWVWVSAGAWLVGVAIPVVVLSLLPNAWPLWSHVVGGVVAAVAMGVTVGLLTGRTLQALLQHR